MTHITLETEYLVVATTKIIPYRARVEALAAGYLLSRVHILRAHAESWHHNYCCRTELEEEPDPETAYMPGPAHKVICSPMYIATSPRLFGTPHHDGYSFTLIQNTYTPKLRGEILYRPMQNLSSIIGECMLKNSVPQHSPSCPKLWEGYCVG